MILQNVSKLIILATYAASILNVQVILFFSVVQTHSNQDSQICPWSALNCENQNTGMTWSVLVNVQDQNLVGDQFQMIVLSKDTGSFLINTNGKVAFSFELS